MTAQTDLPSTPLSHPRVVHHSASDAVYGIGLIGAMVYYIGHATDLQSGAIGFFKALFWPAFMIYKLLEFLKM